MILELGVASGHVFPQSDSKSWGGHSTTSGQGGGTGTPFNSSLLNASLESSGDGALDDYIALAQLYIATGGHEWKVNTGWMKSTDVCKGGWQGAICAPIAPEPQCDAGRSCGVCLQKLAYPDLECPTDEELASMLDCANAPNGTLCEADGECGTDDAVDNCGTAGGYDVYRKAALPSTLGVRRLTTLTLPDHNLVGTLPSHLVLASHLQHIHLGENALSGTLPSELSNLTSLHTLSLSNNQLSGTLPPSLFSTPSWLGATCGGHLGPLGTDCGPPSIYLSGNKLSGTIPTQLGVLRSSGVSFYCGDGSVAASKPSTDGFDYCHDSTKCPCGPCCDCSCQVPIGLEQLHLHRNQLSGTLPSELGAVELATPLEDRPFEHGRTSSRLSGTLRRLSLHDNSLSGTIPSTLGNLTALEELRLKNNLISGTLPNSVRLNESWPRTYGVRGGGGGGLPSELGVSNLRLLGLENNRLSGSVPPSMVPCTALVDLHRTLKSNLLSGSTPLEVAGHVGAQQRMETFTSDGVTYDAADIPEVQRLRQFRVSVAAVDAGSSEPSSRTYESRDACMFSPNVLFRCAEAGHPPGDGGGPTYAGTGGTRRCEEAFTQHLFPGYDIVLPLSLEYNHRKLIGEEEGGAFPKETPRAPGGPGGQWARTPRRWEADERTTPLGPAAEQEAMG